LSRDEKVLLRRERRKENAGGNSLIAAGSLPSQEEGVAWVSKNPNIERGGGP